MAASLYDRIGGEHAVLAAVEVFYHKVLADELVGPFFVGLDMDAQVAKQMTFMVRSFGGPAAQSGRDLRTAHARLVQSGMGDAHFDQIVQLLEASLRELDVAPDVVAEVVALVASMRSQVLGR